MKQLLAAGALALSALAAHAQNQITVYHAFTPDAIAYMTTKGYTPDTFIAAMIATTTTPLTGSSANFSFTIPGGASGSGYTLLPAAQPGQKAAYTSALSDGVAARRDATASDIVVTVSDFNGATPVDGYAPFTDGKWTDSPAGTVVVDVRAALTAGTYAWLHEVLDHQMKAGHQRAPGDTGSPYNHGAYYSTGTSLLDCKVVIDVTTSRWTVSKQVIVPSCNGWPEAWLGGSPPPFMCDAGTWCTAWSQSSTGQNGQPWSKFHGDLSGSGTGLTCTVKGTVNSTPPTEATANSGTLGLGTAGPNGIIICPNVVVAPRISGDGVLDQDGFRLGDALNDNIAFLNGVSAAVSQRHLTKRWPAVMQIRSCVVSGVSCGGS